VHIDIDGWPTYSEFLTPPVSVMVVHFFFLLTDVVPSSWAPGLPTRPVRDPMTARGLRPQMD